MTTIIGGTTPANLDHIGIGAFTAGTTTVATGSVYRVSRGLDFVELTGSFTYDSAGVLTGGTITGWKQVDESKVEFTASDFSIPVADFLGWVAGNDNAALVNAVLGGGDTITGSIFTDGLNGGAGNDTMAGGKGDDYYTVSEIDDQVIEVTAQGTDIVYSTVDSYVLAENVENLSLLAVGSKGTGNALDNRISALLGSGDNRLEGDFGNDTLAGGEGADTLIGGQGNDTYIVTDLLDILNENANGGTDTIRLAGGVNVCSLNSPARAQFESIYFDSKVNSVGEGNASANVISGRKEFSVTYSFNGLDGNDTLSSGQGNDTLTGGTGADVMTGFGGNDIYEVDDAKDVIVEVAGASGGTDQVNAQIDHVLGANVENLSLLGAAVSGTGNTLGNSIAGSAIANKLAGLLGDDSLTGGGDNDTLDGGAGNDTLDGGAGIDSLVGGVGNDLYLNVEAGDVILELAGQGIDTIEIQSGGFTLDTPALANIEHLTLMGGTSKGTGNSLNNVITSYAVGTSSDTLEGGLGNDTLNGGSGNDKLVGGAGNDTYIVDSPIDSTFEDVGAGIDTVIVVTGPSSYTLNNNVENLVLDGISPNGKGNALANTITGNDQSNDLDGLGGNDTLIGGKGHDTYHLDSAGDKVVEAAAGVSGGIDHVISSVDYVLAANVETLTLAGIALKGTGNGASNAIYGNVQSNKLVGLAGNDTMDGDKGDDALDGGAGNDSLLGGDGVDSLAGGAGNDQFVGGVGADTMAGGAGNDFYHVDNVSDAVVEAARQGIDTIHTTLTSFSLDSKSLANVENLQIEAGSGVGNSLNNLIFSFGNGNEALSGLSGNDTLDGGFGADSLEGGKGNDTYYIDDIGDTTKELAGEGTDTIVTSISLSLATVAFANIENVVVGGPFAADIDGNALNNAIKGHDSFDDLFGAAGNDALTGNAGDDVLDGGIGIDLMIGGAGDDQYTVDNAKDRIVELASAGSGSNDMVVSNVENYVLSANIEQLDLGAGAMNGTGNAQNNNVLGNDLGNRLSGMGGNDTLAGGLGSDTLIGGAGNDLYVAPSVDDLIVEAAGQGIDTIQFFSTDFSLETKALANVENLAFGGGVGVGNGLSNRIIVFIGTNNDTLFGGAGNDTLEAGGGADSLIGGKGNDTYLVENALDAVVELANEGRDTVHAAVDFSLSAKGFENVENLRLTETAITGTGNGLANVITSTNANSILNGLDGNDTLIGGSGSDNLDGGSGADLMSGGKGDDFYTVDNVKDRILELAGAGAGTDTVTAYVNYALAATLEKLVLAGDAVSGTGNALDNQITGNNKANKLAGSGGNDSLFGDIGADTLDGGAGNDLLQGGTENDSLLGGAGDDTLNSDMGADTLAGGTGNDLYVLHNNLHTTLEVAGQGIDSVRALGISITLGANLENGEAIFGANITGNDLGNLIDGSLSSSGNNSLSGMGGNDTLVGGVGADTLTGGAGQDRFVITFIDSGVETVTDFDAGPISDVLDLSDLLVGYTAGTSNANDFVKFVDSAGNTNVQVDIDGAANGVNFIDVCLLEGVILTNVNQAIMEGNLLLD